MASTITARYESGITVVETFTGGDVAPGNATVSFGTELAVDETLTASTSIPVTKHAEFDQALTSGSATINLAALPGKTADETVVGTGLKVQMLKLRNKSTNANLITVTKGASNGYGLGASGASWTVPLSPGQEVLLKGDDANPDIASGARTIDVSGTGAQVLQVEVVMG